MKKISHLFVFFVLILVSCSEDDNSVNSSDFKILPMNQGNYWIYQTVSLDSNGKEIAQSLTRDSVVISGEETIDGKNAKVFDSYIVSDMQNRLTETMHYYAETEKLYMHSNYIKDLFAGLPVSVDDIIKSEWLMIVNRDDDFWKISEYTIEDFQIFGGISFDGDIMITGENKGIENIEAMGQSFSTEKFTMYFEMDGSFLTEQGNIPFQIDTEVDFYFSEGVGMVKQHFSAIKLTVPLLGDYNIEGRSQILQDYKLN